MSTRHEEGFWKRGREWALTADDPHGCIQGTRPALTAGSGLDRDPAADRAKPDERMEDDSIPVC